LSTESEQFNDRVVQQIKQTNPKDVTKQMLAELEAQDLSKYLALIDKAAASLKPK
jgi:hypothetical protein